MSLVGSPPRTASETYRLRTASFPPDVIHIVARRAEVTRRSGARRQDLHVASRRNMPPTSLLRISSHNDVLAIREIAAADPTGTGQLVIASHEGRRSASRVCPSCTAPVTERGDQGQDPQRGIASATNWGGGGCARRTPSADCPCSGGLRGRKLVELAHDLVELDRQSFITAGAVRILGQAARIRRRSSRTLGLRCRWPGLSCRSEHDVDVASPRTAPPGARLYRCTKEKMSERWSTDSTAPARATVATVPRTAPSRVGGGPPVALGRWPWSVSLASPSRT